MVKKTILNRVLACGLILGLFAMPSESGSKQTAFVSQVFLDAENRIHVKYSDGREDVPPKERGQISCSVPAVAKDKRTVGWLVDYDNLGATSYPIPLKLIIYRDGKRIRKLGNGMLIGTWRFSDNGKQVAFYTNTVHGDLAPYYELHDIETDKIVDKWEGQLTDKTPAWAKRLSE